MTAFRAYLRVVSSIMQPDSMTERIGVRPDSATEIGSRRRPESPPRQHATWERHVVVPGRAAVRPEDFEPVILGWGSAFAEALGDLNRTTDVEVSLVIVQEIRDIESSEEKGIFLSPALMAWLGKAHASLDIDQYIYHECDARE